MQGEKVVLVTGSSSGIDLKLHYYYKIISSILWMYESILQKKGFLRIVPA